MAQFSYYPARKLFNNISPNTKNLNHDTQEFFKAPFYKCLLCSILSVQEPAFIKKSYKKNLHAKN